MLTSINDIPTIGDAIRRGALDYLTKETTREELTLRLRNILSRSRLENENRRLRRSLAAVRMTLSPNVAGHSLRARRRAAALRATSGLAAGTASSPDRSPPV